MSVETPLCHAHRQVQAMALLQQPPSGGCILQRPRGCHSGRIAKWGLELMGLDITYTPRTRIMSQVLTHFMVEWTEEQASTAPTRAEY